MSEDNVVRIKNDLYQKAKDLAEAEGINIADAVSRLVENGGAQPSACELLQFRSVLEDRGLIAPKRPDWVWGVTDILPPEVLAGTKLEPYAQARVEAELRCSLADELFDKLEKELGSEAVEKALDEAIAESVPPEPEPEAEPVATPEATESEQPALPIESQETSFDNANAGAEGVVEPSPPAEAKPTEEEA